MIYVKLALLILFQPKHGFTLIKRYRGSISRLVPLSLLALFLGEYVACIYLTHFPLRGQAAESIRLFETIMAVLVPLLSWMGGIYLITTIRDGETTLFETVAAMCFCLLPYIVLSLPIALLSNILTAGEIRLYHALLAAMHLWCVLLMIYSVMSMNTYTLGQTLLNCLLAVFAVVFIWAVCMLIYLLQEKIVGFIDEVFSEYRMLHRTI